jgi:hypothetical protein
MQRPTGVTILAVLAFVGAGLLVLAALAMFLGGAIVSNMSAYPQVGMMAGIGSAILGVIVLGFAALDVLMGVGLWKLQNWARILTIVLSGLALLGSVLSILSPFAHIHVFLFLIRPLILAAIYAWILMYLFKPHVKQAFGATGF